MTADQTIALISSIGTCLSAIATFLTIRQIAKQREASYRPELAFSRTFFVAEPDPIRAGALPEKWVNKKLGLETPMLLDDLSVPLRNVGLGTAKAIAISWSFPIDQTIERVNQSAQKTLTPAYFSRDDWGVSLKSESLGNGTSMWKNQKNVSVDFVLPASVEREPMEVRLPHAYVQLCSAVLYFASKDKHAKFSFDLPILSANIEYVDIGNLTHRATFEFILNVVAISGNGEAFDVYIDCTKRV
ncbi:MAG: hypothetical protein PHU06_10995 [Gallionella sp.]|nr:hypothetical protein [Gallionella sp.]